jgi:hypothetical protein
MDTAQIELLLGAFVHRVVPISGNNVKFGLIFGFPKSLDFDV